MGWFGAVQSQDYPAAKWALGQRLGEATEADLDRLFDEGALLRTHVMRPTWHFVLPEDVRWLQELTAPRVLASMAGRFRQLELDDATIDRAGELFAEALAGGRSLIRTELGEVLERGGISGAGQRLPHLLAAAEHANLITSGPRRGKQHTYALLQERAPAGRPRDREDALAELARRYFRGHGPARDVDFSWWSGLSLTEARRGIDLVHQELEETSIEGKRYWMDGGASAAPGPLAHLLPNFDEISVAYRDRAALLDPTVPFDSARFSWFREQSQESGLLSNILVVGGHVRGSWKRTQRRDRLEVELRLLAPLSDAEFAAVEAAAGRYARFLGALTAGVVSAPEPA